jgi:glycosyltransferase involved in cell wall biosynthesis
MVADVSVVVPTFRRPAKVVEAVESALTQEGVEVDVLVLDDSPEGSAREPIEALSDPRVRYMKRAVPSGGNPALPRNEGWPLVRGRYVHFLDDDDRVKKDGYRALVAALDASPRHGVAFGCIEPFGENAAAVAHETAYFAHAARRARVAQRIGSRRLFVANMLFASTILVNSACIIRRESIAALGGYDPECVIVEDVDFYLRAIRKLGGIFVDDVVLEYRIGPSLMHENPKADARVLESYERIYAKYRAAHGEVEFRALQLVAKSAFRLV